MMAAFRTMPASTFRTELFGRARWDHAKHPSVGHSIVVETEAC